MKFSEINVTTSESKTILYDGKNIAVKQYLPLVDKMNILEMVIQTADAGTILNTLVLDAIFEVYLLFKYTDIEFTEEEKKDVLNIYDTLENTGLIEEVIKTIPESEYKLLRDNLELMIGDYKDYRNSAKGCVDAISIFAPTAAEKFNEEVEKIDTEKLENVTNLAQITGFRN